MRNAHGTGINKLAYHHPRQAYVALHELTRRVSWHNHHQTLPRPAPVP
jgi:hypothetical protein